MAGVAIRAEKATTTKNSFPALLGSLLQVSVGTNVTIKFFIKYLSIIQDHEYKEVQRQMMERQNNKKKLTLKKSQ